jgi:integrase
MQRGSLEHFGNRWFVRFTVRRLGPDGKLVDKKLSHPLGPWSGEATPPREILAARDEFMATQRRLQPLAEKIVTLEYFVTKVFLPDVERNKKPATYTSYQSLWRCRVAPYVAGVQLATIDVEYVQNLLDKICDDRVELAKDDPAKFQPFALNSIKMLRGFLSAVFKEARRRGFYKQANPITDTRIDPRCTPPAETRWYTAEEVRTIARLLDLYGNDEGLAATVFLTSVCHSLRPGETEALDWDNLHDGELHIERTMSVGKIGSAKTRASRASIPLIRQVSERLEFLRERMRALGWHVEGPHPLFVNAIGGRLRLASLLSGRILPILNRCAICNRQPGKSHAKGWQGHGEHVWTRQFSQWKGWHSGRRGTATLLGALGVNDKIIQRILRHSNWQTTAQFYRKPTDGEVKRAMERLGEAYFEEPETQPQASLSAVLDSQDPKKPVM